MTRKLAADVLDDKSWHLLLALQRDGRMPLKLLAKEAGLSVAATAERVRRLEECGVIRGIVAEVDVARLGYGVRAIIGITVAQPGKKPLLEKLRQAPEVLECHHVAGADSYVMTVVSRSLAELERFIGTINGYGETRTSIVYSTPIERRGVTVPGATRRKLLGIAALLAANLLAAGTAKAVQCQPLTLRELALTVCRVDLARDRPALYHRDAAGQPLSDFAALRRELATQKQQLLFAMNAGMYEPDRSTVGLLVQDGREVAPPNLKSGNGNFFQLPNGVLLWGPRRARVLATHEYVSERPRATFATQSGPMLVHRGQISTSAVMNPQSTSRKIRNGVCAPNPSQLVFVISEQPVTFFEFAGVFKDSLRCREALYLDGTVSSLYYPPLQRDDQRDRLGPMVGVVKAAD